MEIGSGVVDYPPAGWTRDRSEPGQTVLQKAGVVMIIGALAWTDTPLALATAYRDAFFASGELTANEPTSGEIGERHSRRSRSRTRGSSRGRRSTARCSSARPADRHHRQRVRASGTLQRVGGDIDTILSHDPGDGRLAVTAQPGIFGEGVPPRWGYQTSFWQRRQPAFWLFVAP